MEKKTKKVI